MTVRICLDGGNPLSLIGNLEHGILIAVQRDQPSTFGWCNPNLYVGIGQTRTVIAESDRDEVTFAPIPDQSLGIVIVILQGSGDLSPGNTQAVLNISY